MSNLKAVEAALRVLTAISYKRQPEAADVQALEECAGPKPEDLEIDDFACRVIHEALATDFEGRKLIKSMRRSS